MGACGLKLPRPAHTHTVLQFLAAAKDRGFLALEKHQRDTGPGGTVAGELGEGSLGVSLILN